MYTLHVVEIYHSPFGVSEICLRRIAPVIVLVEDAEGQSAVVVAVELGYEIVIFREVDTARIFPSSKAILAGSDSVGSAVESTGFSYRWIEIAVEEWKRR